MFDAHKYAEHFPDERQDTLSAQATSATTRDALPSPVLLAALRRLEREFSEILRAQQPESAERSE
jgi:hypothetical protein